ncbi:MAG: 6-hydroxymethyl-7,8-dihydropterin pyrophosphokinase, partial [Hadesarchaea archaeon]
MWENWKPRYMQIVRRLNIDPKADENAARVLEGLLPESDLSGLKKIVHGRECVIFGAGPSLETDLEKLERGGYLDYVLISADGATSAVLKYRNPEVIVTDLDGYVDDQVRAWKDGSWMVVHAHGDNIHQILQIVPKLKGRVVGTTQIKPFGKLFNFGGFTDGDRAAFMAHGLGASKIYLAGMDFGTEVGKFSGQKNPARKAIKLRICRELLSWL